MMVDELNMLPDNRSPLIEGLVTLGAFVVAGAVPLLYYLLDLVFHFNLTGLAPFLISTGLSGVALFGLGASKVLVTERGLMRSGLEMLVVGGLAAGVAYAVGALLKGLVG
jgi:VIT1/CCC1 family predicted Fe2+/Mn2+ transporter